MHGQVHQIRGGPRRLLTLDGAMPGMKDPLSLDTTGAERRILVPLSRYRKTGDGYIRIQPTKPQALA